MNLRRQDYKTEKYIYKESSKKFQNRRRKRIRREYFFFSIVFWGLNIGIFLGLYLLVFGERIFQISHIKETTKSILIGTAGVIFINYTFILTKIIKIKRKTTLKITADGIYPPSPRKKKHIFISFEDIKLIEYFPGYGFRLHMENGKKIDIPSSEIGEPKRAFEVLNDLDKVRVEVNES